MTAAPLTWTYMGQRPADLSRADLVRIVGELGADLTAARQQLTEAERHRFRCPFRCSCNPRTST